MRMLKQKKMMFTLYEENNKNILSVVCGTVGIFEKKVDLDLDEFRKVMTDDAYLDDLVKRIRDNPTDF